MLETPSIFWLNIVFEVFNFMCLSVCGLCMFECKSLQTLRKTSDPLELEFPRGCEPPGVATGELPCAGSTHH